MTKFQSRKFLVTLSAALAIVTDNGGTEQQQLLLAALAAVYVFAQGLVDHRKAEAVVNGANYGGSSTSVKLANSLIVMLAVGGLLGACTPTQDQRCRLELARAARLVDGAAEARAAACNAIASLPDIVPEIAEAERLCNVSDAPARDVQIAIEAALAAVESGR